MSEIQRRDFECRVGGYDLNLRLGNCAVVLFRTQQEVDYIAVDLEDEDAQTLRVFNNVELVRWMAGYRIKHKDDNIFRQAILRYKDVDDSFRELTGWTPPIIEKEFPAEREMEFFLDVNASHIDEEWNRGL